VSFYSSGWIQHETNAQAVRGDLGSLIYPLFPNAGNRVTDSVEFACCSSGRSGREIAGGLGDGRIARTIYQSFLIDFGSQGTDDLSQFGLRGYEMWNGGIGDPSIAVRLFVNSFSGDTDLTLEVTTPTGTQEAVLTGGLNLQELAGTHLIVLKFQFEAGSPDLVSVFLDPTDSIEGNWTPSAIVSAPNSDLVITHHGVSSSFTFSGPGHIPAAFDELRWGDTFADVTPFLDPVPTPAPGVMSLFLLGVAGIAAARRRRFGRPAR
jgi:MYXO-CTERM domain-containing protein